MNGLIFFEDGTVVPFGQMQSIQRIVKTAQEILPELLKREREQLLQSISEDELKVVAERVATSKAPENKVDDNNSNV